MHAANIYQNAISGSNILCEISGWIQLQLNHKAPERLPFNLLHVI